METQNGEAVKADKQETARVAFTRQGGGLRHWATLSSPQASSLVGLYSHQEHNHVFTEESLHIFPNVL